MRLQLAFGMAARGRPGGVAPPASTGTLTATAISSTEVQLAFTDSVGATSHEYRLDGITVATLAGDKIVTGLTPGTTYDFEVRGRNSSGGGAWSNVATEATDSAATPSLQFNDATNSQYIGQLI